MMVMSRVSRSGIVGGIWADRVVEVNRRNGRTKGNVFTKGRAGQAKIGNFEDEFHQPPRGVEVDQTGLVRARNRHSGGLQLVEVFAERLQH